MTADANGALRLVLARPALRRCRQQGHRRFSAGATLTGVKALGENGIRMT